MAPKKVMITGVSGIVGSSAYLHMRESPDEREYMRARQRGDFTDLFKAPTY